MSNLPEAHDKIASPPDAAAWYPISIQPPQFRRWLAFALLAASFLLQWSLLMNILGPTWDAAFYYGYARSLAFDQDLSIENDLLLSYPTASADFVDRELHANRTSTGHVYAPFAIGSGLLWLPFLLTLRLAAFLAGFPASGFDWYLIAPIATFSALTGLLSFYVAYHIAARATGTRAALLSALTVSFATPLIYYQFREPLYAHVPSALLNTLFLFAWWRSYRNIPTLRQGLVLGVLLGLAALMRWQNAIYAVLPLISSGWAWLRLTAEDRRRSVRSLLTYLGVLAAAFLVVFSVQLFVWQIHYGSWLTIPQGSNFMSWTAPFLRELLISPFRGLLPWMPVFGLAFLGMLLQARHNPRLVIPLFVLLVLGTYINASSRDWFAGGGFGPRRSVGELTIVVLGYAWLLSRIPTRLRLPLGAIAGIILALHQWLLLRFALAERIGGMVLSMAPEFEWAETTLAEFVTRLVSHLPDVFSQPLDVFVFPASPLHHLLQGRRLPLEHLVALFLAATFIAACLSSARAVYRWWRSRVQEKTAQVMGA